MAENIYKRKMSYNERLFVVADEICPPAINQFQFDGHGFFDKKKWQHAVQIASDVNPGSRLVLKGHLGQTRWVDSRITPEVTELDAAGWDGTGPDGAPFLLKRLPPRSGPTCEIFLIHGDPLRVCFRTHHAIMDGMGTLTWIEDIFRVLRDERPLGTVSTITDTELARSVQKKYRKPFPKDSIAPTGMPVQTGSGVRWKRITVPGRFKNLIGQIAVLSAREAWKHQDGPVRFTIPVDLRMHSSCLRSTGNLSIAIYIEITRDTTPESIALDIKKQLVEKRDCMIDRFDPLICHLPMKFLVNRGRSMISNNNRTGRYGTSGIISNMGKLPMNIYSGGGFTAKNVWGIPPSFENIPYFVGFSYTDEALQLSIGIPDTLAANDRMEQLSANICRGLKPALQ